MALVFPNGGKTRAAALTEGERPDRRHPSEEVSTVVLVIAATAGAQLASACQSGIRKGDAVACLHPDEAHLDQGVKSRALALVGSTASPGQSDVAQQFGLFFVPASRHPATPIFAASTFCVASSLSRAHQGYNPEARTVGKAKGNHHGERHRSDSECYSPRRGRRWLRLV